MQTLLRKSLIVSGLAPGVAVIGPNAYAGDYGDSGAIGTPGTILQVKGTLVCDTDGSASGGNSVFVDTPLVDLDDQGDAQFHGNVGALPSVCASEPDVGFLVRVSSGRWIANGTVLR
jgi:hypothetical protein